MINTFNWKELAGANLVINYAEDIDWSSGKGVKVETAIGFDKRTGKYYILHQDKQYLEETK